jgi:CHAT domain-containing protein/tetratricopeptide (TPR) repeat protein
MKMEESLDCQPDAPVRRRKFSRPLFFLLALALLAATLFALRKPAARYFYQRGIEALREWRTGDAVENFRRALRLDDDFTEARFEKALCHQLRGQFIDSRRELDLLSDEPMGAHLRMRLINAVGVNHFNSGESDAAIRCHIESLDAARSAGDKRMEAQALIDLSRALYHLKGQADRAMEHLEASLRIGREIEDEIIKADALRNLGAVRWWFKGELDRPLAECYEPALEIYRRRGELRRAAITLCNIALVHAHKGDLFQFFKYQNESIELKLRVEDMAGLCDSWLFLGSIYETNGNYRKAREYYLKSVEMSRRLGYKLGPTEENALASIYTRLGEYDKVTRLLDKLIEAERDNPFQAKRYLSGLAYCHLLEGRWEEARRGFERVLEIERLIGEPDVRTTIAMMICLGEACLRSGDFDNASRLFRQAEDMAVKQGDGTRGLYLSFLMAEAAWLAGREDEAMACLAEAAEMESRKFTSLGTILTSDQTQRLYDRLFALLLDSPEKKGAREMAFRLVEQLKYSSFRNFVLQLEEKRGESPRVEREEKDALLRIERASIEARRARSASTREQLRRAYSEYEDAALKAEMTHAGYTIARRSQPVTLDAAQRALDRQTAIVEYLFAGERVYALLIARSWVRSALLPVTKSNLAAKVKLLRSLVFDGETGQNDWQKVACDLRRSLIDPIESELAGINRLGVIPAGFLHDLPFAALARMDAERARFLIEDYSIFYAPSASWLANRSVERKPSSSESNMLSFGRNESGEPELLPLEFAVEEARAVASLFGGEARVESEATETRLKRLAPRFHYIHFAMHAVTEPEMPLLSRLKLQSDEEDDGNLTVREILALGLDAELVTLGACQTAQSHPASGGPIDVGRIGLVEAFLHAGSKSVMASLLPVSDRPTTELMKAFYTNLRSKEKIDALAETQRAMIRGELFLVEEGQKRELSHPRYWSPFILAGDWR